MDIVKDFVFTVAGDEVDINLNLKVNKLIEKLQIANDIGCNEIGLTGDLFKVKGVVWILLNDKIIFHRGLPSLGDEIIIETRATGTRGAKFFREDQVYLKEKSEENLIAINGSIWIIADEKSHRPKRPTYVMDKEDLDQACDMSRTFARSIKNLEELDDYSNMPKIYEYKVSYSDLDHNRHFHNTNYVKLALDAYAFYKQIDISKEKIKIDELNISYKREVFIFEDLEIFYREEGGYSYFEGRKKNGDTSFIIEALISLEKI